MHIKHSKPFVDEKDIKAVAEQVKSANHATQEKVRQFENQLKQLISQKYAKATSSGTTALHLSLLSLNIKKGDEVIIPDYVCQDVLHAVHHSKAVPVLADISDDFNISAKTIQPLITKKTKAIILPHLFGIPVDINPIIELAKKYNILIIEDCAQSLGAKFKDNTLTGSKGIISIFSFYATKIISTGQGGMILTSNPKISQNLQQLTTYDKTPEYNISYNYNLTDIQAVLGISQLKKLSFFIRRRKEIAEKYNKAFQNLPIILIDYKSGFPFRYIIKLKNKQHKDKLKQELNRKNIEAKEPVFKPLHHYLNLPSSKFPNSEKAFNTLLSIPIYPAMTDEEVEYVIENMRECFK